MRVHVISALISRRVVAYPKLGLRKRCYREYGCGLRPDAGASGSWALCFGPSVIGRGSGGRVEDGAVQGRPGNSEAGGYLGHRDVGGFEQRSDGLDLFGGEFGWAPAFSTASTRRFQASNGALPDQITFEFGILRRTAIRALCGVRDYAKPQRQSGGVACISMMWDSAL